MRIASSTGILIVLLGALLGGARAGAGAQVSVDVSVVPTRVIFVGDPATLELAVTTPAGVALTSSPAGAITTAVEAAGLTLLDQELSDRRLEDGRERRVVSTRVSAYTTGSFEVPALRIAYRDAGGTGRELRTRPVSIEVASVLAPTDLREIRGPGSPLDYVVPLPLGLVATGVLIVVVLAGAFALARRRARPAPPPPPKPPYDEALELIAALLAEDLPGRGQIKEHCDRLSDILRRYLTRIHRASMDLTTRELLDRIDRESMAHGSMEQLERILDSCDQAKFAMFTPGERFLDELAGMARSFLALSRPRPVVKATAQDPAPEDRSREGSARAASGGGAGPAVPGTGGPGAAGPTGPSGTEVTHGT